MEDSVENRCTDELTFNPEEDIGECIGLYVEVLRSNYPNNCNFSLNSVGERGDDFSIYTGYGGNLFTYWKLSRALPSFIQDYSTAIATVKAEYDSIKFDSSTFYIGKIGLTALLAIELNQANYIKELLINIPDKYTEYELLYGAAGGLYTLGFVLKHWETVPYGAQIVMKIQRIVESVFTECYKQKKILFKFPQGYGKTYLGAAHGVIGLVHILLQLRQYLPNYDDKIRETIDYIITLQFKTGNFPVALGQNNDDTVHFCHGSPGAVPMLALAYTTYKEDRYLQAAIKGGNDIWRRGLLKKGRGLCHGAAGNGYSFLALYKATSDIKWLNRALNFAQVIGYDENYDMQVRNYDDQQRIKIGEADHPYSLMEGIAGSLCYLVDCINPKEASFPGYDF